MWQAEADTELTLSASTATAVGQLTLTQANWRYSTVRKVGYYCIGFLYEPMSCNWFSFMFYLMHKDILAAVVWRDKSPSLGYVKPLAFALLKCNCWNKIGTINVLLTISITITNCQAEGSKAMQSVSQSQQRVLKMYLIFVYDFGPIYVNNCYLLYLPAMWGLPIAFQGLGYITNFSNSIVCSRSYLPLPHIEKHSIFW